VERTLQRSGIPRLDNGYAIDVVRIIREAFDFDVAYIDGLTIRGRALLGALVPAQKLLLVEAGVAEERRRFTVAHECGHLVLEYRNAGAPSLFGAEESGLFSCNEGDLSDDNVELAWRKRRETLANMFAARLLMPAALCREARRCATSLEESATLLKVSRQACRIRFGELGLLPF
jgi:Zn-dependent peptidase ImmA (M78 family)